ncbi:MAG: GNAT family N-acetyltransferase [Candidatus Melainabacteria bacterium]|nr:GNAT family N-acetyltransferase [Candidatus Melainabacteria bacterium]
MQKPCPLKPGHKVDSCDCGEPALNTYLQKHALQSQRSHGTVTYVSLSDNQVVGYYTLLYGSISSDAAPKSITKGLGAYSVIPIIILARLSIDRTLQGKGLGKGLLKDALYRASCAAQLAGLRAFVIHAKNNAAKAFYEQYDFEPLPENPLHLFRLISDIKRELER